MTARFDLHCYRNENVARGIVATAINQSSVCEKRSRVSIGLDEKVDYNPEIHKDVHVFRDHHEGCKIVESIGWILRKVCLPLTCYPIVQSVFDFCMQGEKIPPEGTYLSSKRVRTISKKMPMSEWIFREEIIVTK